ncbi:MAG: hemin uptake protein HemP [Cytophagales bacterium]|nr:hemin uptake protein HemP [Rhizobacter sp.]
MLPGKPVQAPGPQPAVSAVIAEVARVSSQQLLAGGKEVLIEHHGSLYRLRETALGKLILTK